MIFQPKIGQDVKINYKDKAMPCQGLIGNVAEVSKGPGPRNVKVRVRLWPNKDEYFYEIIPRGNIVAI